LHNYSFTAENAERAEKKLKVMEIPQKPNAWSSLFFGFLNFSNPLRSLRSLRLKIHDFDLGVGHVGQLRLFDEINDLVERRVDPLPVVAHGADPQDRFLPEILVRHFRNRNVEALARPLRDALQNLPFSLQGKIIMEIKLQLTNAYHHLPIPAPTA
jgi:hypothetical protein